MANERQTAVAYRQLATNTVMEIERLSMLQRSIENDIAMLRNMVEYYDKQALLYEDNEMFGFDLNVLK